MQAGEKDSNDPEAAIPLVAVVDSSTKASEHEANAVRSGNALEGVKESNEKKQTSSGLTKEELEAFVNDPFWRRLRLATLILFCVVWLCLFASVILIVAFSPRCPPRPQRHFWQKPLYRLQLASFAPAQGAGPAAVGSVEGLTQRLGHVLDTLGVSNLLLAGRLPPAGPSGCPRDFAALDPALGSLESLKSLGKTGRKKGFSLLVELDLSQADPAWAGSTADSDLFDASGPQLPRPSCKSLNVASAATWARVKAALSFWLDTGVSGFALTNVAYIAPANASSLYSNASVEFVRRVRSHLEAESSRLGRSLALFVDPGDTGGSPGRLAAYLDRGSGAHAVVSVGLGKPLLQPERSAPAPPARDLIESVLAATTDRGSVIFATAWPTLRRPADPVQANALSLTLPGVPVLYYGQELGMAHVASLNSSESPMQWGESVENAGWLTNATALTWTNLVGRATDIRVHNLQRLASSGHPRSVLQVTQRLISLATTKESLQWGSLEFLPAPEGVLAFRRRANRYPAIWVVANSQLTPTTVNLQESAATGRLQLLHSAGSGVGIYQEGEVYQLGGVFVPGQALLVFQAD